MKLFNQNPSESDEKKSAPPEKGLLLFFYILYWDFFSLIKVNLLFFLFCIPVITIPAAYCAMTRIIVSMVRDKEHFLWTDFWNTFRKEFKKATVSGLILGVGMAASAMGIWYYWGFLSLQGPFWPIVPFSLAGAILLPFVAFSLFPMISLVDLPLGKLIKNACLLVTISFFRYAFALLICATFIILALMLLPLSLVPVLLLYPSLLTLITVLSAYGAIKKHILA